MPREDRRLYFDNLETYKALYSLCGQKHMQKPAVGVLKRIDTSLEDVMDLNFYIENSKTLEIETETYSKDFVTAALMVLCQSTGIPIAKRANKILEVVDDKLVLRIQILR